MRSKEGKEGVRHFYNHHKLVTAVRHNRLDLGNGVVDIPVTEVYEYGAGGEARVNQRTTSAGAPFDREWLQTFTYTPLGVLNVVQKSLTPP